MSYDPASRSESPLSALDPDHFEYVDRPLQLVTFDMESKSKSYPEFQATEEALDFLRSIPAPIGVVAVAGMYRTGKSYLLNRIILNRKKGFGVGPTVNACTKGLWIWGRPISATTSEGDPCSIIVVDSEGIGALDEDNDHDSRVFSLAILLASYFIYNSTGSIDENALQNLSFVVNLTKHIHIKSQQSDDPDGEDYAAYFPAFMWVVRDFSLQLVSPEGDPIPPKEYLERALMPQKGFTDAVEDKNRIRRLLKNFFKERDCFTMVRPAPNEADLQRLAEIELEDLRSEFVEQVMLLRKKIVNKVKPKMMNGKCLSGQMLANLLITYVTSINEGAVPSIETAWSYICKTECTRAFDDAIDIYIKIMHASVNQRLPMGEDELRLFHKEAKEAAVEHFNHKAVGSDKDAILRNLTEQLGQKYAVMKQDNSDESELHIMQFLQDAYSMIDKRLNNGEFHSLLEYEKELKAFKTFFISQGPPGPQRKELLLDFCNGRNSEASDYFLKNVSNELQLTQQLSSENYTRLEVELRETKEELLKQRDTSQRKLTGLESEKAELSALSQSLKEQVQHLRTERERVEKELREAQKQVKQDLNRQLEEASSKTGQFEESMKELERRLFQAESEHQQEKALLQQKIAFTEKSLEESNAREKTYLSELKSQKATHSQALKEMSAKHESALRNYQSKVDTESDHTTDLERSLTEKEAQHEALKSQWEETEKLLNAKVADLQASLVSTRTQIDTREAESKQRTANLVKEQEAAVARLKTRLDDTDKKLKTTEEAYKSDQAQWLRNNAVLQQKSEFLELQCAELKIQLEDQKRQTELLAKDLQAAVASDGSEALQTQIQRLTDLRATDVREFEQRLEDQRKKANSQLEDQIEKTTSVELKLKLDSNEWTYKETQLQEKIELLAQEKARLSERIKALSSENTLLTEEGAAKLKQRIKDLERQMEEMQAKASREIAVINSKSEESLQQLKNFYEIEKERLEHRVVEEKGKAESRYNFMVEEFEQKIREDTDLAEDQRLDLEAQIEELNDIYGQEITQLKQQIALDAQKIETLERHLKETKDNLASIHTSHALAIEQQLDNFNKERANLLEKIERLAGEAATKEKELTTVTYRKEQLENQLAIRDKELEEARADFSLERVNLMEKLDDTKTKLRLVSDELSKKKSEFMKENALAAQQNEFHSKRLAELAKAKEDLEKKHAEALVALKDEKTREMNEAIDKLITEKEALEKKLDAKRRALKETESSNARQLAGVEKERAVTFEKLSNLELKFAEQENRYTQEIAQLKNQLKDRRGSVDSDKIALQLENERLKTLAADMEKQLSDHTSSYERDKTLWENKFNFLSAQRDQARTDLSESQKKFEQTIEEMKKKMQQDREKYENSSASAVNSVESRFGAQLKELQASSSQRIAELTDKNKVLERDLRLLREQLEQEKRGRSVDYGALEERNQNLMDSEQRLLQEVELVKKDRDRRVIELQELGQQEKDEWKAKLSEAEKRVKDMEQQRGQLFLEHEKERARWAMDRDHLTSQKNEAQENAGRMQKRNEALLKENEKLRAERPSKLRTPAAAMGKKDGKAGVSILGTSISFQDYLASTQTSTPLEGGQRISGGVSHEGSSSGQSDLSPRSGQRSRTINAPRAMSPLPRKLPQKPAEPAFKFDGKEDPSPQ